MRHNLAISKNAGHENARKGEYGKPRMHKCSGHCIRPAVKKLKVFNHYLSVPGRYTKQQRLEKAKDRRDCQRAITSRRQTTQWSFHSEGRSHDHR